MDFILIFFFKKKLPLRGSFSEGALMVCNVNTLMQLLEMVNTGKKMNSTLGEAFKWQCIFK